MPTRARSEPDQTSDPNGAASTAQAEIGAAVHQPATGQTQGFLAGLQLPLPGMGNVDPLRLLWLGGLAALATIEIIEWPVALTLGAGSYIAERLARQEVLQEVRPKITAGP
ncbi:MAG TPA: hypothetical protein VN748_15080 [Pseudonocardiaceae bacterium]|jgi:hydrogenase/urease accessory protein HupE|nr:hypothetical protein [Pseudonocardiaceae bacterium]